MKKRVFQLGIYLPNIRVEGEYNLQGKVLILPLLGNGPAKIHLSEYNAQHTGSRIQLTTTKTTLSVLPLTVSSDQRPYPVLSFTSQLIETLAEADQDTLQVALVVHANLLGCDVAVLSERFATLRRVAVREVKHCLTADERITVFRNVANHSPKHTASRHRRSECSTQSLNKLASCRVLY